MRIDGMGGPAPLPAASRGRRSKAGFAELLEPDTPSLPAAADGGSVAAVGEPPAESGPVGDPLVRDRLARRHAAAMLEALALLQASLLGDANSSAAETLAALAEACPQAADPRLEDVLQAIAVRAAVELARRG